MTKDEAMRMALDALENVTIEYDYHGNPVDAEFSKQVDATIKTLCQALEQPDAIEAAVLAEREACAKVCESLRDEDGYEAWGVQCAEAIRERMK